MEQPVYETKNRASIVSLTEEKSVSSILTVKKKNKKRTET